ncbi:MAG: ABC transporter permease [Candidatus Eremiobacteraeota bacterium]|nr:ABC transporter permease [Candidatus Eremiobacteraeota bacterium]
MMKTENEKNGAEEGSHGHSEAPGKIEVRKISYWQVAWGQFSKNKIALAGLWCVVLLLLIAIFCPLIASNVPYYVLSDQPIMVREGYRLPSFLFVRVLFDRNCYENAVDIFFNLIMVLFIPYVVIYLVVRKLRPSFGRFNVVAGIAVFHLLAFLVVSAFPYTLPQTDFKTLLGDLKKEGKHVQYLFPPVPYSYREIEKDKQHPQAPSRTHMLGTDAEGRDVFTRMLYGTRISMTIGVVAVSIYVTIGIILGSLAGYFGGRVDLAISRLIEVFICFPTFFLILTLAAFIEKRTIFHVMLLIGLVSWTGVARLVRGEFLRLREMDYVQAAIAMGISKARIIFSHILPNAMAPVLVSATFGVAAAILIESSLAFLGLGDPSAPSWGGILNVGREQQKLWLIIYPGIAIFFVVSVFNLVGEALRDAMDPRLRQ